LPGYLYCIDNDIIKKLATFDLFYETIKCFNIELQQIRTLKTAKYKFRRDWQRSQEGKSRTLQDTFTNYEKTLELVDDLLSISESTVDPGLFASLSQVKGIDQGEAILTSYVVHLLQQSAASEAFILTGDKVFLRTLATLEAHDIEAILSNRIWCLEQLILKNIKAYGFDMISRKIVPVRECDATIKAVFGSGAQSTSNNALVTLQSYINALRAETGNLLHPYPD